LRSTSAVIVALVLAAGSGHADPLPAAGLTIQAPPGWRHDLLGSPPADVLSHDDPVGGHVYVVIIVAPDVVDAGACDAKLRDAASAPVPLPAAWLPRVAIVENRVMLCAPRAGGGYAAGVTSDNPMDPAAALTAAMPILAGVGDAMSAPPVIAPPPPVVAPAPPPAPEPAAPLPKAEPLHDPAQPRTELPPISPSEMYGTTFYEVTGGVESVTWPSGNAKDRLDVVSIDYHENHGGFINVVLAIFAMAGTTKSGGHREGDYWVWTSKDLEDQAKQREAIAAGAASLPFSLDVRVYHDMLGSDINGFQAALLYDFGSDPRSAWQAGLGFGDVSANRRSAPPGSMMPAPDIGHTWLALEIYNHRTLKGPVALYAHGSLGTQKPWLVLVEAGPEVVLARRFIARAIDNIDVVTQAAGGRLELGVRF
jgi:hypothetical protein